MNALKKITVVSLLLLLLFIRPVFAIAPPGLEPMSGQPTGGKHDPFLWSYYLPYFTEMRVKDYVDVFINYAFQTRNPGCAEWLQENKQKVEQFLQWSGNYRWPSAGSNETNGSQAPQGR